MSDDRSCEAESNEEKFEEKNRRDNDQSGEIALKLPAKGNPLGLCFSVEENSRRSVAGSQQFSRFSRDRPDDLIDGAKRDFPKEKNCGSSMLAGLKRPKDDNPDDEERYAQSTYFCEPIHHERNVAGDRKGDKFIPSEVAEDTGTRSESTVECRRDEVDCDRGKSADYDDDDDDNGSQGFASSVAMDKSPKSLTDESHRIVASGAPTLSNDDDHQEDHGNNKSYLDSCDPAKVQLPTELRGSPELRRKFSRTDAVRYDARRLKTATLDRMGKMFKLKSTQSSVKEAREKSPNPEASKHSNEDHQSRKEKTSSLGRMLKLADKNGEPRKLFPQSRAGSLSHVLRRKSTGAEDETSTGKCNNPGVFSRLLKQWKNRSGSGNATAEPNLCASTAEGDRSLSAKPPSTSRINPSSSPLPALTPSPISPQANTADVEYTA